MQVVVDNSSGELMPGAFANTRIQLPENQQALAIPAGALIFGEKGLRVATVDAGGKVTSSCPGTRVCGESGLSPCQASAATKETCNGLDDDCNGKTDEGLCNDDNPCTDDACDVTATACKNVANKLACDDGNACTTADTCANGKCAGQTADCDDKNACTADTCDVKMGCQHKAMDGAGCDDSPITDGSSRKNDRAMTNPNIMTDFNGMSPTPVKKRAIIVFILKIGT